MIVRGTRMKYEKDTKQRQNEKIIANKSKNNEQFHVLSVKIERLQASLVMLLKRQTRLSKLGNLTFMSKSNALRAVSKQLKEEAAMASAELARLNSNIWCEIYNISFDSFC